MKKLILSFCVASLLGVTGIADALPFQNGSFENPGAGDGVTTLFSVNTSITGWTVVNGSIDYLGSPWQAAEGTSSIDMSGILTPGILTQNFDTVGGTLYEVIFAMAGNPLGGDKIKDLGVSVANFSKDFTFDTSGKTITDMGWTNFSFTFLATDLLTTLTFTSLENNAFGAALDNVRVNSRQRRKQPCPRASHHTAAGHWFHRSGVLRPEEIYELETSSKSKSKGGVSTLPFLFMWG